MLLESPLSLIRQEKGFDEEAPQTGQGDAQRKPLTGERSQPRVGSGSNTFVSTRQGIGMEHLDSALEALPHEIKLAIASHLVPTAASSSSRLRRNAALAPLASASPVLYAELGHLVNAEITITDRAQIERVADAAPKRIRDQVRTLRLHGPEAWWWSPAEVDTLLRSLSQLSELHIAGGYSGAKQQLVESLAGQTQLRVLEVDFGGAQPRSPRSSPARVAISKLATSTVATLPWNARADNPRPVPGLAVSSPLTTASDGSGNCSSPADSVRTSLSLKKSREDCCTECCEINTSCFVRASLETCPALVELRLANDAQIASAPCEPCNRSSSSSMLPPSSTAASLRTLRLESCALSAPDLVKIATFSSLDRLELFRCSGLSTHDIVDALKASTLRHFGYEAPPPAPGSPASSPRPATRPPLSSPSQPCTSATADALLPCLSQLESLSLVGNVLSPSALASLPRQTPFLKRLCLSANPDISLEHLASLVNCPAPGGQLEYLEYEPRPRSRQSSPFGWCDASAPPNGVASDPHAGDIEVLWKAALALNISLVGSPFREVQDRFRWATLEAEKARSRADEAEVQLQVQAGAVRTRRKRPSLACEA
jgi:hypothetical protein